MQSGVLSVALESGGIWTRQTGVGDEMLCKVCGRTSRVAVQASRTGCAIGIAASLAHLGFGCVEVLLELIWEGRSSSKEEQWKYSIAVG